MKIAVLNAVVAQSLIVVGTAHAGNVSTMPEPGSLALLSIGAAAVAAGAWWRNRK
jgi:hypothetical protein